jgi:hypothetical protein
MQMISYKAYDPVCRVRLYLGDDLEVEAFEYIWETCIKKEFLIPEMGAKNDLFVSDTPSDCEYRRLGLRQKQLLKTIFQEFNTEFSDKVS